MATNILTLEGIIENGQIRVLAEMPLPEDTRVFIIVPEIHLKEQAQIFSPRLKHPEQSGDFVMEVSEGS